MLKNLALMALALSGWIMLTASPGRVVAADQKSSEPLLPMFGNTPADEAKRQVVFGWATMLRVDRQKAMETYMAKDFKEHPGRAGGATPTGGPPGSPGGPPATGRGFSEAPKTADGRRGQIKFGPAGQVEDLHMVATVDGNLVTLYWTGGVDIFSVENGKITAHWDASPQTTVTVYGPEDSPRRAPPPAAPGN